MDFQSENFFRKLRLRAFQLYHRMLYMLTLSTLGISISIAFNAIYVDTVNTAFTPHSTLYKVLCKSHKHQCMYRQCRQKRYHTQYTIALL